MCGFAGLYSAKETGNMRKLLGRMGAAVAHRGPDDHGLWQDNDAPFGLAHQRLSVIDTSAAGAQPMISQSGRYVIAYNGELYNMPALRRELENDGVTFEGRSDTEVLLAAIEHWRLNLALQKLKGMFAFALWDRKDQRLHLIRDRFGKKPLYVGWAGDALVFGSELKALRAHPEFTARINRRALSLYMRYGYVPAPHCIYEGVAQLSPGCRMGLHPQQLAPGSNLASFIEPYWSAGRALHDARGKTRPMKDAAAIDTFEELLSSCVQDRLISDVPIGAFLSGGIDSSAVVALMQKLRGAPVQTFTIGFEEAGFDEAGYAKKIAAHLGTDHHELYIGAQEALSLIPQMSQIYDEPFADPSAIPTAILSRFTRENATVALSGDGGDEMLGGYNRHIAAPDLWNRMKFLPRGLRVKLAEMITRTPPERWNNLFKNKPQIGQKLHKASAIMHCRDMDDVYTKLTSHFEDPAALVIGGDDGRQKLTDFDDSMSLAEKMMAWDATAYLPGNILTKTDRASMAYGLEVRSPLLDTRIFDFAWSLPDHMKIRGGRGKWLLREVLRRHVPAHLFERPKQGFNVPVGEWLRVDLRDWAEHLLDENRLRDQGYLHYAPVRQLWQDHLSGKHNYGSQLWVILMFQAWLEKWD